MAMKCPECESENPEGKKYCGECGGELPQPEHAPEEGPIADASTKPKVEAKRRKWLIPILAIAVAAILIGAALGVYFSPDYSWDASIRDHDGDGYSDNEDVFPYDSTEWIDTD
ncbi:MAG: zinc ribbon domain-containing protein, partial [Candidatus Thermoplasmatota archaeon]|nr:zinc ribbon domain-containing protein [Candidatus Thermoplasmatota archaeon]